MKREQLIKIMKFHVDSSIRANHPEDIASWGREEGILISPAFAREIIAELESTEYRQQPPEGEWRGDLYIVGTKKIGYAIENGDNQGWVCEIMSYTNWFDAEADARHWVETQWQEVWKQLNSKP